MQCLKIEIPSSKLAAIKDKEQHIKIGKLSVEVVNKNDQP